MPATKAEPWFPQREKGRLFMVEELNSHDGMPIAFTARDDADNKFYVVLTEDASEKPWWSRFAIFLITQEQMVAIHGHGDDYKATHRVCFASLEAAQERGERIELVTTDFAERFESRTMDWRETLEEAIGNMDDDSLGDPRAKKGE
jgi:hypothetical protein